MQLHNKCVVFVYLPGETTAVPAGILTVTQAGRDTESVFEYGNLYRKRRNAVPLDPDELPLVAGEIRPPGRRNLFGVFRDSAPDAWGRLAINDRYLRRAKPGSEVTADTFNMPEIEYLLRSRSDRVGALDFREKPTDEEPLKRVSGAIHLKELVRESHRIALGKPAMVEVQTLLHPATGMGGARPKTTIEDDEGLWLAKFPMEDDTFPVTRIEHAMLKLAALCDIQTIDSKLLKVEGVKRPVFLIRRFDRKASAKQPGLYERLGYCSALTAQGLDETEQTMGSYQEIAQVLRRNGHPDLQEAERAEVFRRMVLNVLVNNDDDHLRNHGLLRVGELKYRLAPAFDVVPRHSSPGLSTTRRMATRVTRTQGDGDRDATVENLLSDTEPFGLTREQAAKELARLACIVQTHWRECCEAAGMKSRDILALENAMSYAPTVLEQLETVCAAPAPEKATSRGARRARQAER